MRPHVALGTLDDRQDLAVLGTHRDRAAGDREGARGVGACRKEFGERWGDEDFYADVLSGWFGARIGWIESG